MTAGPTSTSHVWSVRVPWRDCDPYDHVNHASYVTYLESARIAALDDIGWGMSRLRDEGLMIVVAELSMKFRIAASFDDDLEVRTITKDIRPASSRWSQTIARDSSHVAEAEVVGAMTDLRGRPVRMPHDLARAISSLGAELPGWAAR